MGKIDLPSQSTAGTNGVVQVNGGNVTATTALANGTTATTQSAHDNSTKVATTAYVDAAGGGSGSGGLFGPIINKPTISGTGLTTAFNQRGTFSATDVATGILLVDSTTSATENIEGITQAYPGSPYTLTSLWSLPILGGGNFNLIGPIIAASTGGKILMFGFRWNGAWQLSVLAYNSFSSFNSFPLGNFGSFFSQVWLKLQDDGTNIFFSFSYDGIYWVQMYTVSRASSFLGSSGFNLLGAAIDPAVGLVGSVIMSWGITFP